MQEVINVKQREKRKEILLGKFGGGKIMHSTLNEPFYAKHNQGILPTEGDGRNDEQRKEDLAPLTRLDRVDQQFHHVREGGVAGTVDDKPHERQGEQRPEPLGE